MMSCEGPWPGMQESDPGLGRWSEAVRPSWKSRSVVGPRAMPAIRGLETRPEIRWRLRKPGPLGDVRGRQRDKGIGWDRIEREMENLPCSERV
jgi:hypothetical protein